MKTQAPKIFQATDILSFLNSWANFKKETDKKFSLRKLATQADISPALLVMILKAERHLNEKTFLRLLAVIDLKKQEKEALRLLFIIGDTEDPDTRLQAYRDLQRLPGYKEENKDTTLTFNYLTNWLNVAIREMASLPDFEAKPNWIKSRLHNSPSLYEIQKSLDFLTENKYLTPNENGKLSSSQKNLVCSEGVFKISLGDFHRQMLTKAGQAIDDIPRNQRLLLGHTLALSTKDYNKVFDILNNAIKEIENLKMNATAEEIFHIELVAFPLTKSKINEGDAK